MRLFQISTKRTPLKLKLKVWTLTQLLHGALVLVQVCNFTSSPYMSIALH
uniref:Uncharacterized protein n=1 Tax=Arundo donax TaxID=35708 RepID=A0A0A9F865_ARUDO